MMTPLRFSFLAALAAVLVGGPVALAQTSVRGDTIPQIKFTDYRLPNGLRVILSVDHYAPVVAVSVTYNVGSRNERPGRTGFAHLFEHMMFQGSKNVGKGEHMMLINDNGGMMNGTTNKDRTNFFESLPANQLDLALFLEADRMASLDISQANLDNQIKVVEEEKRQSYDNQPYGEVGETIDGMAYSSFGYRHTTIGSMADLDAATLADVQDFHDTYYAPNNAVIAVVGDFNEANAKKKIEKYFGGIKRHPDPPQPDLTEPPLTAEQRKTLRDPLARATRYEAAYKTVAGDDPDAPALQILSGILSRGRTGRLYSAIVEKRLATSASAGGSFGRGPGLFTCTATLGPTGSVDAVEKAFDDEIAKIQRDGVTVEEMAKARAQSRASAVIGGGGRRGGGGGILTDLGKANILSQDAVFYNDPGRTNKNLARLESVTAADVQRVAQKYLNKNNRVVVIVQPDSSPEDDGGQQ